jgi:hypothetical protein
VKVVFTALINDPNVSIGGSIFAFKDFVDLMAFESGRVVGVVNADNTPYWFVGMVVRDHSRYRLRFISRLPIP